MCRSLALAVIYARIIFAHSTLRQQFGTAIAKYSLMEIYRLKHKIGVLPHSVSWQGLLLLAAFAAFSLVSLDVFAAMPMSPDAARPHYFPVPQRSAFVRVMPHVASTQALAPMLKNQPAPILRTPEKPTANSAMSPQEAKQILEVFAAETSR